MSSNKKIPLDPAHVTPRPLRLRIDTQTEDVRIDLIPLIDVIFCILTFFLLSAVGLSRQQAINVDIAVPKASTGTPQGRQILVVSLNELGQVYVEKEPVTTKDQFLQKLQAYRQKNPDGLMALYASANASYNQVVQVLDLLRQVGGDRVALATIPGKTEQAPSFSPAAPPATGVPSYTPYPGDGSLGTDPYGIQNPANPINPTQPQVPGNGGGTLPRGPGDNLNNPPPLPGQTGVNPGNSAAPTPSTQGTPNRSTAPGNSAAPTPATQGTSNRSAAPGNSAAPTPATQGTSNRNTAPGNSAAPTSGTQVAPNRGAAPQD